MASDQRAEPAPISSEPLALASGEAVHAEDAPFPTDSEAQEWEATAQLRLSSMAVGRDVMACEMDSWIDSDLFSVPEILKTLPRSQLHRRVRSLQKLMLNASPEVCLSRGEGDDLLVWERNSLVDTCIIKPTSKRYSYLELFQYITSLKINPTCDVVITDAGDGTVGLFGVRTGGVISHFSVGSSYEVTSVSFSSCGTYFHASSTSNNTLVWDTRLLPMSPSGQCISISDSPSMRALHCLSHGKPMPTAEHAGQLPGFGYVFGLEN